MLAWPAVDDKPMTVREVAEYFSVSTETVRRWLRTGKLRGRAFGGRSGYRVTQTEVRRFMEEQGRDA